MKFLREEYNIASMAQKKQLFQLWYEAGLCKGRKTHKSSTSLETKVAALETRTDNNSDRKI